MLNKDCGQNCDCIDGHVDKHDADGRDDKHDADGHADEHDVDGRDDDCPANDVLDDRDPWGHCPHLSSIRSLMQLLIPAIALIVTTRALCGV